MTNKTFTPEQRQAFEDALERIRPIIISLVRRRARGADYETCADIRQEIISFLWSVCYAKYILMPGCTLDAYLMRCATFRLLGIVTKARRQGQWKINKTQGLNAPSVYSRHAKEGFWDRKVERIACMVLDHPERFLRPNQVRLFRVIIENPTFKASQIAREAGYKNTVSIYKVLRDIHARIAAIDIQDMQLAEAA